MISVFSVVKKIENTSKQEFQEWALTGLVLRTLMENRMRKNLINIFTSLILIAGFNLGAYAEEDFKGTPAGLLTFSTKVPIELDDANHQVKISSTAIQAIRNEQIIREKTLPWEKLCLAIIAILFFIALKNIPKKREEALPMRIKTAQDKAKEKLGFLKSVPYENNEEYYKQLSDILRAYIEDRYQIKALQKTTEEFLGTIQKSPLPIQFPEKTLSQFLILSDRVKFAKEVLSPSDYTTGYKLVKEFIEQ